MGNGGSSMSLDELLAEQAEAARELACLSPKQRTALILAAKGYRSEEIGQQTGVTAATVRYTLEEVRRKLDMGTTMEAVVLATRARWV